MANRSKRLIISYKSRTDVLYISIGKPRPGYCEDKGKGFLVRIDPKTKEIIGFTIVDFTAKKTKTATLPLDFNITTLTHLEPLPA